MISIVIPILNEANSITDLLNHLIDSAFALENIEIIIVDGGSTDGSQDRIKKFKHFRLSANENAKPNIRLLRSEKGRAKQMNTGAKEATGSILYFLHADSFPPKHFDAFITNEVIKGNLAGCFKMKFKSSHWWLRLASWLTKFSWRACRGGDQSQFITKALFNKIGRFDEQFIIYEDNDLINKLYARKQFVVIQKWLTTSARRYQDNGIWTLQYHFWMIYVKKWFGASPVELYEYYKKYIV